MDHQVKRPDKQAVALEWQQDVLGEGFESATLDLGSDDDFLEHETPDKPRLVATLVRSLPQPLTRWNKLRGKSRDFENLDVLYVHGWSDYFFQAGLAKFWTDRGARFYALDLRRYGRSFREGQTPGYVTNLDDYDLEVGLAIDEINDSQPDRATKRRLILLGHSTGGLVLSLWCSRNPGVADALVLNSPWLELQLSTIGRQLIAPVVNFGAKHVPFESVPQLDYGFYARAQKEVGPAGDLSLVNLAWRPDPSHVVHSGWLGAILRGHARVHEGLAIQIPICVLLSNKSALPTRWSDELTRADTVLDVDVIAEAALRLGSSVTIERIDGALHDVFLSASEARAESYGRMERWVRGWTNAVDGRAR